MNYKDYKEKIKIGRATIYNDDCMNILKQTPDNYYSLALVDPPYGIDNKINTTSSLNKGNKFAKLYNQKRWDKQRPEKNYFKELFRVSKNQIICGSNYFIEFLPVSRGWIVWDKQGKGMSSVNDELIFTSFDKSIKTFSRCHGLDKGFMNKDGSNIHPTQKPVALYEWLLSNYAKQGDSILDTHMGSGSIAIATNKHGFDLTACELDADYYKAACDRIKQAYNQPDMFTPEETKPEQAELL